MHKYMPEQKDEISAYIEEMKAQTWGQYGVTIVADGWISYMKRLLTS